MVVLAAMRDSSVQEPGPEGVHEVGVIAHVERAARSEDQGYQVRCLARVRIVEWTAEQPYLKARIAVIPEEKISSTEVEALRRELVAAAQRMIAFFPQVPDGVVDMLDRAIDPAPLVYMLTANLRLEITQAQEILAATDVSEQMRLLLGIMQRELEVLEIGQKIRSDAQSEIEQTQRDYILRQQLKAIQKELGEDEESSEIEEYRRTGNSTVSRRWVLSRRKRGSSRPTWTG